MVKPGISIGCAIVLGYAWHFGYTGIAFGVLTLLVCIGVDCILAQIDSLREETRRRP